MSRKILVLPWNCPGLTFWKVGSPGEDSDSSIDKMSKLTCHSNCVDDIDSNFNKIMRLIPLRFLVVTHCNNVERKDDNYDEYTKLPGRCPMIGFLRRLISLQDEWLEEVEFINLPDQVCDQWWNMGDLETPRLKSLRLSFTEEFCYSSFKGSLLAMFCENAPNLKSLRLQGPMDLTVLSEVPESMQKNIEQFNLSGFTDKLMEHNCILFAKREPALRHLELQSIPDEANEFYKSFKTICAHFLRNSQSRVEVLCVEMSGDPDFADRLNRFISDPVKTVKSLSLSTADGTKWFSVLHDLDFDLFPAVRHVSVTDEDYYPEEDEEEDMNVDIPDPDPVLSVSSLHLNINCGDFLVTYFQHRFPNITRLQVEEAWPGQPFSEIWESWPNLEELVINQGDEWDVNFDAEMCGIFPAEADYLRRRNTGYLQSVHIVPIKPALTTARKMKILRIELDEPNEESHLSIEFFSGKELFSDVACYVAFQKLENLTVVINCEQWVDLTVLERLKKHVQFTKETKIWGKCQRAAL